MAQKKRSGKTTREQFLLYLSKLENNEDFRENKLSGNKPDHLKNTWTELVNKLNSSGGPVKDVPGWKKTFADWKFQFRKRARAVKMSLTNTGNIGEPEKPLNDLEQRLLHLTGNVVIEGLDGVPEIGLPTRKPERTTELQSSTSGILQTEEKENEPAGNNGNVADTPSGTRIKRTIHDALRQLGTEEQLKKLNTNLEKIIKQNDEIIKLKKAKLQLQFNVEIDK